jgi:hydroxyacylglutathione hydrolase
MTTSNIITIKLGIVNAYLIHENDGFLLIDTGYAKYRNQLNEALTNAGCKKGNLKLIVVTHGDGDHCGNAAFLREEYGARIAMSKSELKMVKEGDESESRKGKPDHLSWLFTIVVKMKLINDQNRFEGFVPDLFLEDGQSLNPFGFEAKVLALPGHSKGSIGVLTSLGDLFCGDLLYNLPGFGYIDDESEHKQSLDKIKQLKPRLIYPGHGKVFVLKSGK